MGTGRKHVLCLTLEVSGEASVSLLGLDTGILFCQTLTH